MFAPKYYLQCIIDNIILIAARQVAITFKGAQAKQYYHHHPWINVENAKSIHKGLIMKVFHLSRRRIGTTMQMISYFLSVLAFSFLASKLGNAETI